VIAVIFLFLGSVRAALIPALALPVSLMASFIVLLVLGYSVNLLTLLALVLAIGLVVDDAIVVLENVQRRIDGGEPPLLAAFRGARQVAFAVVATTLVLIAVFVPIAFLSGNVGRLFSELAVTIAAAVAFSSLVALTLSPMMCSKVLRPSSREGGLSRVIHRATETLARGYSRALSRALARPAVVVVGFVLVLAAIGVLFRSIPTELAPGEDRGVFNVTMIGPEGAGFEYSLRHMKEVESFVLPLLDSGDAIRVLARVPLGFGTTAMNGGMVIIVLDHWDRRPRTAFEIMADLSQGLATVPGVRAFPFMRSGLGQRFGQPVQFVIGGTSYEDLARWQDSMLERAAENPGLLDLDGSYKRTKPQIDLALDRSRAADLGVSLQTVGRTLETMLGSRRVTTYLQGGEEYEVILQGEDTDRQEPSDVSNLYVRSERSGRLIPLSSLVRFEELADAPSLTRFNRLRAATISASLAPGYSLGEALAYLEDVAAEELPADARIDYKGESLEFVESSSAVYFTFALALLVVFLVLAAQFESYVQPFVIMLTVPLAVAGALFALWASGGTLNIYSQIGIVILIGLAAKNGILIVEFTNQLRDRSLPFEDALREAARTRFRPILMTGLSTAIGALPLVLAGGAGSASRATIGIVIFAGVLFATLLTLFVVPVFYSLLARRTGSPDAVSRELARFEEEARWKAGPAAGAAPPAPS
jgi:multidrug efflux pump